jgi:pyruvate dehydrogenase E2 component (dihydrolipoyllysine-residue acetyltransferase)
VSSEGAKGQTEVEEPSAAQRLVARRVAEARATVPDVELSADVEMSACARLTQEAGWSLESVLIRACALALREVPRANGAYRDGRFELYSRVNLGLVVATADAYVIPVVFDADQKSLSSLAEEVAELTIGAARGQLSASAFSGATFTVWNLGAYGVQSASLVTNPPQAGALASGAVREAPVVRDGTIAPGLLMSITLACDHRILYGAEAAGFLAAVKSKLEDPAALTA